MKTSPQGRVMIETFEGRVLKVYRDAAGLLTAGVGHLLTSYDESLGFGFEDEISPLVADRWFNEDIAKAERIAGKLPLPSGEEWQQHQIDALVSLAFNCPDAFGPKTGLRSVVSKGNFPFVPEQIRRWHYATVDGKKVSLPGLVTRREAEAHLFETGKYPELKPPAPAEPERPVLRDDPGDGNTPMIPPKHRRVLRLGSEGADVLYLAGVLLTAGIGTAGRPKQIQGTPGKFGAQIEVWVREFQAAKGLAVDGVVGPKTWQAIDDAALLAESGKELTT